jgi:hypothetical protein
MEGLNSYFPWKRVIKISLAAFLIQYATNDFDYAIQRDNRAPISPVLNGILGIYEEHGLSGVSAIHAVVLPRGNVFLFGRIDSGGGGLVYQCKTLSIDVRRGRK